MKQGVILSAIISGALCYVIGFGGGALLTRPSRKKTNAAIAAVEAKAEKARTTAQQEIQTGKAETTRLRSKIIDYEKRVLNLRAELGELKANNDELKNKSAMKHRELYSLAVKYRELLYSLAKEYKRLADSQAKILAATSLAIEQLKAETATKELTAAILQQLMKQSEELGKQHAELSKERIKAMTEAYKEHQKTQRELYKWFQ